MIRINEVRRASTKPTPEKVRAELERLGLSQTAAADLLRIDERTMRRYVQPVDTEGYAEMPFASFALLQLMKKDTAR